jgi:uncharacterized protein (TIRG00374 family)
MSNRTAPSRVNPRLKSAITALQWLLPVIVCVIVIRSLGWHKISAAVAGADTSWLGVSLLLFVVSIVAGTIQWQLLLHNKGVGMPFFKAFRLYCVGLFFNNFILGVAGDAVRVAYIKADNGKGKGTAGLAATFLDRFIGLWCMVAFALAGSVVLIAKGALYNHNMATAIMAFSVTFALFGFIAAFIISQRTQTFVLAVFDRIPLPKKQKLREILQQIAMESHNRHILIPITALSLLVQFLRIGVHIACGAALNLLTPENIQYFFVFVPMIAIIMLAPMPFGIKESIEGTLFIFAGFSPAAPEAPIAMGFLASLVGIAASLLGGIFFIFMRLRQPVPADADTSPTSAPGVRGKSN